jgi:aryl-alcohol dehydrogenase-like predicted oxidoreductase
MFHTSANDQALAEAITLDAVSAVRPFGPRRLGASGLEASALGVGTNRWGEPDSTKSELLAVLRTSVDAGVAFFDTAEVYSFGRSEEMLGRCCEEDGRPVVVASKFLPYPNRFTSAQFESALDATLERIGRKSLDLYYLHFPFSLVRIEAWMDRMAEAVAAGRIRAVGVSNCNVRLMRRAHDALSRRGVALAANQVRYSFLHRRPERDGVLQACRELDVALVAYRPLGGGLLRGGSSAAGRRGPLLQALDRIASERGVSASQVALNWLLCQDERVIAIPGATRAAHARENAGTLDWRLDEDELAILARLQ